MIEEVRPFRGPKRADRGHGDPGKPGDVGGRGRHRPQAVDDALNGDVDGDHELHYIQSFELCNTPFQSNVALQESGARYFADMQDDERDAARLGRMLDAYGISQNRWAKKAGVATATISMVLGRALNKQGKPTAVSLDTVRKLCRAVGFPDWAFFASDAVFEAVLADPARADVIASTLAALHGSGVTNSVRRQNYMLELIARYLVTKGAIGEDGASAAAFLRMIDDMLTEGAGGDPAGEGDPASPDPQRPARPRGVRTGKRGRPRLPRAN